MKDYTARIHLNDTAIVKNVRALNRKEAVRKILLWFWDEYKGDHGAAIEALSVDDPYAEVCFSDTFVCSDKGNNYLDEETILRVVVESSGVLERDTKPGRKNNPRRSLKLKKRRRKFLKRVAPNIYQSPSSGTLYYRMMLVPQTSKNGVGKVKCVVKNEPLEAKTIFDAIEEIRKRKLMKQNNDVAKRKMKSRSLKLAEHVVGARPLSGEDLIFFGKTLQSKHLAL